MFSLADKISAGPLLVKFTFFFRGSLSIDGRCAFTELKCLNIFDVAFTLLKLSRGSSDLYRDLLFLDFFNLAGGVLSSFLLFDDYLRLIIRPYGVSISFCFAGIRAERS